MELMASALSSVIISVCQDEGFITSFSSTEFALQESDSESHSHPVIPALCKLFCYFDFFLSFPHVLLIICYRGIAYSAVGEPQAETQKDRGLSVCSSVTSHKCVYNKLLIPLTRCM